MKIEESMKRLAFIKYLYNIAVDQSMRAEPFCSISVLMFHDSIELFLELAIEHLGVSKEDIKFMEYWTLLASRLDNREPTQKEPCRRLNKARVDLKHHGILPSKLTIDGFRATTTNFFEENTSTVFNVNFSDISLIALVKCQLAKENLLKATELLKKTKTEDALDTVAIAFAHLIDDYENRKEDEYGRSPFHFRETLGIPSIPDASWVGIIRAIEPLQDAVKILSLGLDYRRYSRFRLLTPTVLRIPAADKIKYEIQRIGRGSKGSPVPEDVQFCIDFVIESAISLQEFDFNVEKRITRTHIGDIL